MSSTRRFFIENMKNTVIETLGLDSREELAEVCHVKKEAVHRWCNKNTIHPRNSHAIKRLFKFYVASQNWNDCSYPSPRENLREPILRNTSLFDILMAEQIDIDAIGFVGSRLVLRHLDSNQTKNSF